MSSSSSLIQGISISVSDDDEASGKVRVRVRRKRNHRPVSAGRRFLRRAARWGAPLLLAFLAVSLFAYEYYRLSPFFSPPSSPPPPPRADGNLSRVDRAIRAADGARKSCLKMLDLEMLQNLELPEAPEQSLPVKKVVYRSSLPHLEDNISSNMTNSRFNSFTGYQTLTEREESFKPKEIMTVHCGFYSKNGGFKVSDVDEDYMRSCRVVVATCAFGGGDDLHQPIGMTEVSVKKVCYVAFWDEVTRSAQQEEGNKIGEDLMIGLWRIILVRDLPFTDQRLNGKIPKLISHRLFPTARYSIWVDSKSQFRRDPLGVIEALLWRSNSSLALSEHGARSSLYDEGKAIVKKHKATPEEVKIQLDQYRQDGIPDDKRFNGKKGMGVIKQEEPTDDTMEMQIALPSMPSLYIISFLYQSCLEIHKIGGHILDRVILHKFAWELLQKVINIYENFLASIELGKLRGFRKTCSANTARSAFDCLIGDILS